MKTSVVATVTSLTLCGASGSFGPTDQTVEDCVFLNKLFVKQVKIVQLLLDLDPF